MFSSKMQVRRSFLMIVGCGAVVTAAPAQAEINLGIDSGTQSNSICLQGSFITTVNDLDSCAGTRLDPTRLQISGTNGSTTFDSLTGNVTYSGNNVSFNSTTVAFGGGTTTFNSAVSFVGPSITFDTSADFNDPITTAGILNQGNVATSSLTTGTASINTSLVFGAGATINVNGNRIQGVAAGIASTDAVNVAQLNAATSGITTDVTALETTTATHTTQIADLETTTSTHTTQIAAVEAVNATQSTQISGLQSSVTNQASQITAIQALNTTQSNQISAMQATQDILEGRVDTLFDLRSSDRRDMKQGVASAMAMAAAPMPSEPGRVAYAVNGATFRGQYAIGGSLSYRLPGARSFAVNAGFSYGGNKNNGARVGIAGEF